MDEVFLLTHVHEWGDGHDDLKIIGIYKTREDAEAALARVRDQPGFRDMPEGFDIGPCPLNVDHWEEGFVTAHPDGTFSN